MYSSEVLKIFNNPANAGRISKPDGIADLYNNNQTAHVEFSLRIESGIIMDCKFRAQANPYIVAICSTITNLVKGKMVAMIFLDPYGIKEALGDHTDYDIMFCINCLKLAIDDYKEKLEKQNKPSKNSVDEIQKTENEEEVYININEENNNLNNNDIDLFDDDEETDEDFGFFDDLDE